MTEDQIHAWVETLPLRFRASVMGRSRQAARRTAEYRATSNLSQARRKEAFVRANNASGELTTFLDGALESHGHAVHTDVLNAYVLSLIYGHRALEV